MDCVVSVELVEPRTAAAGRLLIAGVAKLNDALQFTPGIRSLSGLGKVMRTLFAAAQAA